MGLRWIFGGILVLATALAAAQSKRLEFDLVQVWEGLQGRRPMPLYAEIENRGPDLAGIITQGFEQGSVAVKYPLEIPSGSKKRVLVFATGYNDAQFFFNAGFVSADAKLQIGYGNAAAAYGLISDNPNDADFLRGSNQNSGSNGVTVGGCKPEDAPERIVAYQCLDVLILGDGTDRLRDGQISAIKDYVLSGGAVLFIGGAGKSAATDPRWSDVSPVGDLLLENSKSEIGELTELVGSPKRATRVSVDLGACYNSDYGLGSVAYLTVNPFEDPVRRYGSRRAMLIRAVNRFRPQAVGVYVAPVLGVQAPTNPGAMKSDPFQIQAPSISQLSVWIVIYIIAVVPLNFLILRKYKKAELAWVTVPILSVLFSLIILRSTIGLYQASATTRVSGVVVMDGGSSQAVALARAEMFFPKADAHDLKLKAIDGTYAPREENNYYYSGNESASINMVDTGRELIAPNAETTNLAFREFKFVQRTEGLKGIRCTYSNGRIRLVNGTKYKLEHPRFIAAGGTQANNNADLAPGGSVEIEVPKGMLEIPKGGTQNNQRVTNGLTLPVVIECQVSGLRVGPEYGSFHPGSYLTLLIHPTLEAK